jgi:hypothetical protein
MVPQMINHNPEHLPDDYPTCPCIGFFRNGFFLNEGGGMMEEVGGGPGDR